MPGTAFVAPIRSPRPTLTPLPLCRRADAGRHAMQNPHRHALPGLVAKTDDKSGPKPQRAVLAPLDGRVHGISHQAKCALTEFELKGVGGADPQWNNKHATQSLDRRDHRAAGRLGRGLAREPGAAVDCGAVRAAGGSRAWTACGSSRGAGEFSFGEDQGCTEDGRQEGPPVRHDRRPTGGADDRATAHRSRRSTRPAMQSDDAGRRASACRPSPASVW